MQDNIFFDQSKELGVRVFNLVFGRALKAVYLSLNKQDQEVMEKIFMEEDQKKQTLFLNKHVKIFSESVEKELKEIEEKLKNEDTTNT